MGKFIKPVRGASVNIDSNLFSKSVEISSYYKNEELLSPADGYVTKVTKSQDDNTIEIKHEIDNEKYVSIFKGVPVTRVYQGLRVSQGDVIGNLDGKTITWTLLDKNGSKLKIEDVLAGKIVIGKDDKKEDDNKKDDKKEKKQDDKKEEKNKKSNDTKDYSNYKPDAKGILDKFLTGAFSPLDFLKKHHSASFEKKDESKESLKEEIERIKKLMIK